jgi:hypothetical protein
MPTALKTLGRKGIFKNSCEIAEGAALVSATGLSYCLFGRAGLRRGAGFS